MNRPLLMLGLLPAGLALSRSLGRRGVQVTGVAFDHADFGIRSRHLHARYRLFDSDLERRDERVVGVVRTVAADGPIVVVPERDVHVETVLRRWNDIRDVAAVPLPDERGPVDALRAKDTFPDVVAAAGLATPVTVVLRSKDDVLKLELEPPFLLKPLESEHYGVTFSHKVVVVNSVDEAVEAWRWGQTHGAAYLAQDLVPDSTDRILSVFAYIGRQGDVLASIVGRKVRQGPPGFGASTVFAVEFDGEALEAGLQLLRSVGYRGCAHVELVRDPRDGELKILEVNTRLPVWVGVGLSRYYDFGPVLYGDLCGEDVDALPTFREPVSWVYLAKDTITAVRLARRRQLDLRELIRPYIGPRVPAVRARGDLWPGVAIVGWLGRRAVEKTVR